MSIQDLGSIGEFVAAIATVVTLVYLAMQIRHNTRALDQTSVRAITEDASRWRQNLIQHPEVAQLYRTGLLEPESLDPIERLRFRMLLDDLFDHWNYQHGSGTNYADANEVHLRRTLITPGGAAYWEDAKIRFEPEFTLYVDNVALADPGKE